MVGQRTLDPESGKLPTQEELTVPEVSRKGLVRAPVGLPGEGAGLGL